MVVMAALLQRDGGFCTNTAVTVPIVYVPGNESLRGERPKNGLCCDQNNHHHRGKVELLRNNYKMAPTYLPHKNTHTHTHTHNHPLTPPVIL
mmetsp:Transcript_6980/g.6797  ORF Transcript_6980/g.6797 Transcript_6980/m.6797 type:complete len:92 (+) Transcript_6980:1305-1580(+)